MDETTSDNQISPEVLPVLNQLMQRVQDIEDSLHNHQHKGFDLSQKLLNSFLNSVSLINNLVLGDGNDYSGTLTIKVADTKGDSYILAGSITASDWANSGGNSGFILGIDDATAGNPVKFYMGKPSNYIKYDGTTLTIVGSLSVSNLDIPDTTTANSMHVDTSGNTWWGANVASGLANAPASVDKTGAAVFKSIKIGGNTIQYTITNNGYFSFGDGSDGSATFDGVNTFSFASLAGSTYTLIRDIYLTDCTVSSGKTLKPAGYRIFGTGTLTVAGTIQRDGNVGGIGGNGGLNSAGTAGAAATALTDGYLKGSIASGAGGKGDDGTVGADVGVNGGNTTNSIGVNGVGGGQGQGGSNKAGGIGGTATASNVKLIANWHLFTLLDVTSTGSTIKFDNSAAAGGGGGGGSAGASGGGGGGGGGGAGGIISIYFRTIVVNASSSITANGGVGGNGGNGYAGSGGGGGGGGGGAGGQVILVYNTLTNNGTIAANGGIGGSLGSGGGSGGSGGTTGNNGNIRQFQISL